MILTIGRKKMRKMERISCRRNDENFLNLFGNIRFGNDNLIIFVKLIMRLYRFHRFLAVRPRDYIIEKNDIYFEVFLPIIILIKILILVFQIFNIDIGLPIVNIFNISAVKLYVVYILYFRLKDFYWLFQFLIIDSNSAIENESEFNSEYDIKKIMRKKLILINKKYKSRYLVRGKE
jgi:hypothetical protein